MELHGKIDVLFNNAAYDGPGTSVRETTDEELEKVLNTNIKGVFTSCREAIPYMEDAGQGVIINTTAGSAREGLAWPNLGAYIASKGAIISFTRALAVELSQSNIRVNSLNPGVVDTPLLNGFLDKSDDPQAFRESLNSVQLMGRIGQPDEIARAALFLASDSSSFVTGGPSRRRWSGARLMCTLRYKRRTAAPSQIVQPVRGRSAPWRGLRRVPFPRRRRAQATSQFSPITGREQSLWPLR